MQQQLRQVGRDLTTECTCALVIDVHTVVNEIQETQQAYVDHGAMLNRMIADAGGMKAVMANEQEFHRIMQAMAPAERLAIEFLKESFSSFQADQDREGLHQMIKQPVLRVFWMRLFRQKYKIPWMTFWGVFPAQLQEIADVPAHEAQEIVEFLCNNEARRQAFQAKVKQENPASSVSVKELNLSFPEEAQLVDRIKELAGGGAQAAVPQRCDIPPLDPAYCGRAGMAAELASSLASGLLGQQPATALCIVASAGHGKSSLAHDIAWRLWEGREAAGVVLVDARKMYTQHEVDGAFCAALQLNQDPRDSSSAPKILARLSAMVSNAASGRPGPSSGTVLLVVVDNAEDPIAGSGCAHFTALLEQIQAGVPQARLLITSREAVPGGDIGSLAVHHHTLPELQQGDAEQVVRRYVDDELISADEVAEVARICGGIPLVLRLVADALKSGRVVVEDVRSAMATHEGNKDLKVLNVLLTVLPKGQQIAIAQLSVFPTIFSNEGAAAAMLCNAPKAKALLAVLLNHGLIRYSSTKGVYSLHPRVQQAVSCEGWEHALQQGRQHQADIAELLKMMSTANVPEHVAEALTVAATPAALGRFLYPLGLMGLPEMVEVWRNIAQHFKYVACGRNTSNAIK
ncbi:hypothetical protein TSOC_006108 [Tetrabaena socialis]|uniref:Uncharacterized protein n=1 Tax=Tetrabaena socialis TaxID=47790 RepID=A0A2J8A4J7_9CHLO|nr:hypothetical protein TSOC_006108 [Tetrabaena socialis]|eukprot:PNH07436.1 hypothetical protein TSOC_006108 [Tetrabaena socialis]